MRDISVQSVGSEDQQLAGILKTPLLVIHFERVCDIILGHAPELNTTGLQGSVKKWYCRG